MLKGMETKRNKIIPIVYCYRGIDEYDLLGEEEIQDIEECYSDTDFYEYEVQQHTHLVFPHMDTTDIGDIWNNRVNIGHIVNLECVRAKNSNFSYVKKAYYREGSIFESFPRLKRAYFKIKKWRF